MAPGEYLDATSQADVLRRLAAHVVECQARMAGMTPAELVDLAFDGLFVPADPSRLSGRGGFVR